MPKWLSTEADSYDLAAPRQSPLLTTSRVRMFWNRNLEIQIYKQNTSGMGPAMVAEQNII